MNSTNLALAHVMIRSVLPSVAGVMLQVLTAVLLSACSGGDPPTAPTLPTFVPPGIIENPVAPGTAGTPSPDSREPGAVANYHFDVALDYAGHRVQVSQLVEVINPGPDVWTEIVFFMPQDLQTTRFALSEVRLLDQVETAATQLHFTPDGFLTLRLSQDLNPHESRFVSIEYGLEAVEVGLATRRPSGDVGYGEEVLQFINWYPQLVPYHAGRGWERWAPIVVGPPLLAEVSDYQLEVRTTEGIVVASGGPVERRGNAWQFQMQNARSIAFSASPAYDLRTRTEAGVTIYVFYLHGHVFGADAVLDAATRALVLFNDHFGHYPYRSLVIAQDAYLSSVAAGGLLLHSGQGFEDYTGQPDTLLMALLPLTMAHLWWGQVVGYHPIAEPWMGASLAMYSEYLYLERYQPDMLDWYWRDRIDYWQPEGALNLTAYDLESTERLLQNTYRVGARFLHELRKEMGPAAFRRFTRDLFRNGAFKLVSGDDFFDTLQRYADEYPQLVIGRYFDDTVAMPTLPPPLTPRAIPGPPATATPVQRTHVVQPGETLIGISIHYQVPIQMIIDRNRITDRATIQVGRKLVIPYP